MYAFAVPWTTKVPHKNSTAMNLSQKRPTGRKILLPYLKMHLAPNTMTPKLSKTTATTIIAEKEETFLLWCQLILVGLSLWHTASVLAHTGCHAMIWGLCAWFLVPWEGAPVLIFTQWHWNCPPAQKNESISGHKRRLQLKNEWWKPRPQAHCCAPPTESFLLVKSYQADFWVSVWISCAMEIGNSDRNLKKWAWCVLMCQSFWHCQREPPFLLQESLLNVIPWKAFVCKPVAFLGCTLVSCKFTNETEPQKEKKLTQVDIGRIVEQIQHARYFCIRIHNEPIIALFSEAHFAPVNKAAKTKRNVSSGVSKTSFRWKYILYFRCSYLHTDSVLSLLEFWDWISIWLGWGDWIWTVLVPFSSFMVKISSKVHCKFKGIQVS